MADVEELKDIVAQTLEANGVLAKIRAELRKHVFLAIDEQESVKGASASSNPKLATLTGSPAALLLLDLVKEYLQFYDLDYSASVFQAETKQSSAQVDRTVLAEALGLGAASPNSRPLLQELMENYGKLREDGRAPRPNSNAEAKSLETKAAEISGNGKQLSPQRGSLSPLRAARTLSPSNSGELRGNESRPPPALDSPHSSTSSLSASASGSIAGRPKTSHGRSLMAEAAQANAAPAANTVTGNNAAEPVNNNDRLMRPPEIVVDALSSTSSSRGAPSAKAKTPQQQELGVLPGLSPAGSDRSEVLKLDDASEDGHDNILSPSSALAPTPTHAATSASAGNTNALTKAAAAPANVSPLVSPQSESSASTAGHSARASGKNSAAASASAPVAPTQTAAVPAATANAPRSLPALSRLTPLNRAPAPSVPSPTAADSNAKEAPSEQQQQEPQRVIIERAAPISPASSMGASDASSGGNRIKSSGVSPSLSAESLSGVSVSSLSKSQLPPGVPVAAAIAASGLSLGPPAAATSQTTGPAPTAGAKPQNTGLFAKQQKNEDMQRSLGLGDDDYADDFGSVDEEEDIAEDVEEDIQDESHDADDSIHNRYAATTTKSLVSQSTPAPALGAGSSLPPLNKPGASLPPLSDVTRKLAPLQQSAPSSLTAPKPGSSQASRADSSQHDSAAEDEHEEEEEELDEEIEEDNYSDDPSAEDFEHEFDHVERVRRT